MSGRNQKLSQNNFLISRSIIKTNRFTDLSTESTKYLLMRPLIVLLLFLPTLVFSQLNQTDANGLRQGKWQKMQTNGRLLYEGE